MYLKLQKNEKGNDYVVGDIHGMYDVLFATLGKIGFNFETDRLFAVGDLVDRGPQNIEMLNVLKQSWFYSVRGNHEQWAIDNYYQPFDQSVRSHYVHGGAWFHNLDDTWQKIVVDAFQKLPIMLETEVEGKAVGFVHADIQDWDIARIVMKDLVESDVTGDITAQRLIWGRTRIQQKIAIQVKGVDHVFLGHTPLENVVTLGNTTYLDTGAVFGNKLTILNINEFFKQS